MDTFSDAANRVYFQDVAFWREKVNEDCGEDDGLNRLCVRAFDDRSVYINFKVTQDYWNNLDD